MSFLVLDLDDHATLCAGGLGLDDEMIVAVRAELVGLLELANLLAEGSLALFAEENQVERRHELVVFTKHIHMALGAVKPLLAAWRANRHLGVHNMFAHCSSIFF